MKGPILVNALAGGRTTWQRRRQVTAEGFNVMGEVLEFNARKLVPERGETRKAD
jgi:hypothetical protein